VLLFGVSSRGEPTGSDLAALSTVDPATICDRIQPYTGVHVIDVEVSDAEKSGHELVAWAIAPAPVPIVFANPGTYPVEGGKQKTAFGRGTVYFRHGAKSEPGNTDDIAGSLERKLESIRKEWLSGVRKVVHAPAGSKVSLLPPDVRQSDSPDAMQIRITDDPTAPAYRVVDPDKTHPFRQKELIPEVRRQLPAGIEFNSFDLVAVRHVHKIDEKHEFSHKPLYGSRQYSPQFVGWLLDQVRSDPEVFVKARLAHRTADHP
jgi:hypothetical protein